MKNCIITPESKLGTSNNHVEIARSLLAARGHFGRLTRLRKAPRHALHAKRSGIDIIDLLESSKAISRAQAALQRFNPARIAAASRSGEATSALESSWLESLGAPLATGRWKPGRLTNRQCGEWAELPLEAFIAVGDGMEISLQEAKRRGAFCIWIADTHCDGNFADMVIRLNTRSFDAIALVLSGINPGNPALA